MKTHGGPSLSDNANRKHDSLGIDDDDHHHYQTFLKWPKQLKPTKLVKTIARTTTVMINGKRCTSMPSLEKLSVTLTFEQLTFKIPKVPFSTVFGCSVSLSFWPQNLKRFIAVLSCSLVANLVKFPRAVCTICSGTFSTWSHTHTHKHSPKTNPEETKAEDRWRRVYVFFWHSAYTATSTMHLNSATKQVYEVVQAAGPD